MPPPTVNDFQNAVQAVHAAFAKWAVSPTAAEVMGEALQLLSDTCSPGVEAVEQMAPAIAALETQCGSHETTLGDHASLLSNAVMKTGDHTVAGIITYTSSPVVPAASARGHAMNKGAVDDGLAGKAPLVHGHAIGDVTNLQSTLDGKAPTSHSHGISDVTGLQRALDGKASTASVEGKEPMSTSLSGVGQITQVSVSAGNSYSLPGSANEIYEYHLDTFQSVALIGLTILTGTAYHGVAVGGTTIHTGVALTGLRGWIKRLT